MGPPSRRNCEFDAPKTLPAQNDNNPGPHQLGPSPVTRLRHAGAWGVPPGGGAWIIAGSPEMASPRLDNRTDFIVFPHVLADKDGERLVAMVKATFECASP